MRRKLKGWALRLKRDLLALWLAARDPRTPVLAKIVAGATAAYAFSPIDLIPDFIPVLGLLDDLVIVPLGIWIALRLIPAELMAAFRIMAEQQAERPVSRIAGAGVVGIWIALAGLAYLALT